MMTEDSFVDFKCPHCGEPVAFPQAEAGCARECPSCMEALIVPEDGSDMGGKVPVPITAPRLVLRRFQPSDWKDLLELMPDAGEDHVLHWLESERQVRLTTPEHPYYLGIQLREGGKLIGHLSLRFSDPERRQALFELSLNEAYKEQDYGLEAVDALLGFCFKGIKLHRVTATCDSKNAAGCRLFEEVGMRREAEFVKDKFVEGAWANSVWYAALAEDYLP